MKIVKALLAVAFLCGCSNYEKKNSVAVHQSMLDVQNQNLPEQVAGYPQEEKFQEQNIFSPWLRVDEEQREVTSGGIINMRITYWGDSDGDAVSFWWKSRKGKFTYWNPTVTYVSWQAPVVEDDEDVVVQAVVSDGRGRNSHKNILVKVRKNVSARDLVLKEVKYYPIETPPAGQPPVYYPGEDVKVEWLNENISTERFYNISVCIWLVTAPTIPNSPAPEELNLGTFEPNEVKSRWTNFYIPKHTAPGYYYLAIKSDCANSVAESNEENNVGYLHIWVRPEGSSRK